MTPEALARTYGGMVSSLARRTLMKFAGKEKTWSARFLSELFFVREDDGMSEMERIPVEDRSGTTHSCIETQQGVVYGSE